MGGAEFLVPQPTEDCNKEAGGLSVALVKASFPFRLQCLPRSAQRLELGHGWPSVLTGTGRMVAVEWAGLEEQLGEESSSGFHREEQEKPVRRQQTVVQLTHQRTAQAKHG